jgi:ABC-type dipeptide/oligopeptide/nickel transport system permease component
MGSLASVFGASILAFIFLRIAPADPARLIVGEFATEDVVEAQRRVLGLDQPLPVQYYRYMRDFFTGHWGFSYSVGSPVSAELKARLPATAELALFAFFFAFLAAVVLALVATYKRRRPVDTSIRTLSFLGLGTPPFFLGLLLLMVFFEYTKLLPGPEGRLSPAATPPPNATGFYTIDALLEGQWSTFGQAVLHLILPAVTLGMIPFAFLVRLLRANLLEVAGEPYIAFARSKGLGRWTAFRRHALPNAFLPTLTAAGLILAQLLGGSVLVERVFGWPGIGSLVVDGILQQDYAVVQACVLLSAVVFVVFNLAVDVLYGVIDPRTRSRVTA